MKCIVIGAGPAGMFAAGLLAQKGNEVYLIEKNEKIGKKLYITGKGRCNITNDSKNEDFINNVVTNSKFLYSAINTFSPKDTIEFIESLGCKLKVERGNRVFPESDKSSDILKAFSKFLNKSNVKLLLSTKVKNLIMENNEVKGVELDTSEKIYSDIVVIATGGKSYSLTGSNGDGYKFAKQLGIDVVEPKPALCAILLKEKLDLAGLSLKNVQATVKTYDKVIASEFGEMLFTHEGVSGPIILTISSFLNKYYKGGKLNNSFKLVLDLKPALSEEQLDLRLQREFVENKNQEIKNVMPKLLPKSLIKLVLEKSKIKEYEKVNNITRESRLQLLKVLKGLEFNIANLDTLDSSIITSGGISIKEINPKNMSSKKYKGLYFIGEVLDVDALTGGFNIQIALSTAYLMANSI